jgi:hypothetical protein
MEFLLVRGGVFNVFRWKFSNIGMADHNSPRLHPNYSRGNSGWIERHSPQTEVNFFHGIGDQYFASEEVNEHANKGFSFYNVSQHGLQWSLCEADEHT